MELTSYEKDILAGKYGEGMAYAMEIQLAIAVRGSLSRLMKKLIIPMKCSL